MPKTSKTPVPDPALPKSNRGRSFPTEVLTAAEINRLIEACSRQAPTGLRNRALIVVLWRAGLRVSEALALMPKDVDRDASTLHVLRGKGGKQRMVALDVRSFSLIDRWLDARSALKRLSHAPIFCTLQGGPLQTAYVRALLPRLAREVGIEKRVHAHALRHTFACELMQEKIPLNMIQKQLGHANLAVTSRYLQHVTPPELAEAMQRRAWPSDASACLEP